LLQFTKNVKTLVQFFLFLSFSCNLRHPIYYLPTETPGISSEPTGTPQAVSTPTEGGGQATAIPTLEPSLCWECRLCRKKIPCLEEFCPDCGIPKLGEPCSYLCLLEDHHSIETGVPKVIVEGLRPATSPDTALLVVLLRNEEKKGGKPIFVKIHFQEKNSSFKVNPFFRIYLPKEEVSRWMFGWSFSLQRREKKLAEEDPFDKVRNIRRSFVGKVEKRAQKA